MLHFNLFVIGLLIVSSTAVAATGSKCRENTAGPYLLCYYTGEASLNATAVNHCTHLVFTNAVVKDSASEGLRMKEELKRDFEAIKESETDLTLIFTLSIPRKESSYILDSGNKSKHLIDDIASFLHAHHFDGVELNFEFASESADTKESYTSFVKVLSRALESEHLRAKRNTYDVMEEQEDDVTTAAYVPKLNNNTTPRTALNDVDEVKSEKSTEEKNVSDSAEVPLETGNATEPEITNKCNDKPWLIIRLPVHLDVIGRQYDLKALSRFADLFSISTHNIANENDKNITYHPSRLMGLSDVQNTDSILDFVLGMGAVKSKLVISLPAWVIKFQLKDSKRNTPGSPYISEPSNIDQAKLCSLFKSSNWTLERDEDLTAPYAYSENTWLAFEDEISVSIKGKYILLRELAGGAIYPIDYDANDQSCTNRTDAGGYLTSILAGNFKSLSRKSRALVLESLQNEIHDQGFSGIEVGVKHSEYRIVRVVDHSGAVHVIRRNTKTQFECSRQGYFSHPLGCNKFYRCVKFDQYSDEYTVFEYDCPAGLAFDERWEVCVWPGSLPNGAPCTGSSEIAPVPRSHYRCPNQEGYYGDPENCRWFFACLDHARDGITPLTAYEFRCPFGLVFNEEKLACDWPWIVGSCGNKGTGGYLGLSSGIHSTFVNGGNLEASYGQYGQSLDEASFGSFGKGFGSELRNINVFGTGSRPTLEKGGVGYIASHFEDKNNDRAPFASYPDYEISGGRTHNNEGVILQENVDIVYDAKGKSALNDFDGSLGFIKGPKNGRTDTKGAYEGAGSYGEQVQDDTSSNNFKDIYGGFGKGLSANSQTTSGGSFNSGSFPTIKSTGDYSHNAGTEESIEKDSFSYRGETSKQTETGSVQGVVRNGVNLNSFGKSYKITGIASAGGSLAALGSHDSILKSANHDTTEALSFGTYNQDRYGANSNSDYASSGNFRDNTLYNSAGGQLKILENEGINQSDRAPSFRKLSLPSVHSVHSAPADSSTHGQLHHTAYGQSFEHLKGKNDKLLSGGYQNLVSKSPRVTIGTTGTPAKFSKLNYPNSELSSTSSPHTLYSPGPHDASTPTTLPPSNHLASGENHGFSSNKHQTSSTVGSTISPNSFASALGSIPVTTPTPVDFHLKHSSTAFNNGFPISKPEIDITSSISGKISTEHTFNKGGATVQFENPVEGFGGVYGSTGPGSSGLYGGRFGTYETVNQAGDNFFGKGSIHDLPTTQSTGKKLQSNSFEKNGESTNTDSISHSFPQNGGNILSASHKEISSGSPVLYPVSSSVLIETPSDSLIHPEKPPDNLSGISSEELHLGSPSPSPASHQVPSTTGSLSEFNKLFKEPNFSLERLNSASVGVPLGGSPAVSSASFGTSGGDLINYGQNNNYKDTSFTSFGGYTSSDKTSGNTLTTIHGKLTTIPTTSSPANFGSTSFESVDHNGSLDVLYGTSGSDIDSTGYGLVNKPNDGLIGSVLSTSYSGSISSNSAFDKTTDSTRSNYFQGSSFGKVTGGTLNTKSYKSLDGDSAYVFPSGGAFNDGSHSLSSSLLKTTDNLGDSLESLKFEAPEISQGSPINSFENTGSGTLNIQPETVTGTSSFNKQRDPSSATAYSSFSSEGFVGSSFGTKTGTTFENSPLKNPVSGSTSSSGALNDGSIGVTYGKTFDGILNGEHKLVKPTGNSLINTFGRFSSDSLPDKSKEPTTGTLGQTYGVPNSGYLFNSYGSSFKSDGIKQTGNPAFIPGSGIPNHDVNQQMDIENIKSLVSSAGESAGQLNYYHRPIPIASNSGGEEPIKLTSGNFGQVQTLGTPSKSTVNAFKHGTFVPEIPQTVDFTYGGTGIGTQINGLNNKQTYSSASDGLSQTGRNSYGQPGTPTGATVFTKQTYDDTIKFKNSAAGLVQPHGTYGRVLTSAARDGNRVQSSGPINAETKLKSFEGSSQSLSFGSKYSAPRIQPAKSFDYDATKNTKSTFKIVIPNQPSYSVGSSEKFSHATDVTIEKQPIIEVAGIEPAYNYETSSQKTFTTNVYSTGLGSSISSTKTVSGQPNFVSTVAQQPSVTTFAPNTFKQGKATQHTTRSSFGSEFIEPIIHNRTQLIRAKIPFVPVTQQPEVNIKSTVINGQSNGHSSYVGKFDSANFYKNNDNSFVRTTQTPGIQQQVVEVTPKPVTYHGSYETPVSKQKVVVKSEEPLGFGKVRPYTQHTSTVQSGLYNSKEETKSHSYGGETYYNEELIENTKPKTLTSTRYLTATEPNKQTVYTNTIIKQQSSVSPVAPTPPTNGNDDDKQRQSYSQFKLDESKINSYQGGSSFSHLSSSSEQSAQPEEQPDLTATKLDLLKYKQYETPEDSVNEFGLQKAIKPKPLGPGFFGSTFDTGSGSLESYGRFSTYDKASDTSHTSLDSGVKSFINPNIDIPTPPKEYIIDQNAFVPNGARVTTQQFNTNLGGSVNSYKTSISGETRQGGESDSGIYEGKYGKAVDIGYGIKQERLTVNNDENSARHEAKRVRTKQKGRGRQYHGTLVSELPATNKYEEYEIEKESEEAGLSRAAANLKNLKNKSEKTVVVSQTSDANPVLINKLAGQCSCQSNVLAVKENDQKSGTSDNGKFSNGRQRLNNFDSNGRANLKFSDTGTEFVDGSKLSGIKDSDFDYLPTPSPSFQPNVVVSITPKSETTRNGLRSKQKQFRGKARYLSPSPHLYYSGPESLPSPMSASQIVGTDNRGSVRYGAEESRTYNEIYEEKSIKVEAGAAFDRYGPGGWRSFDETLQGSVDCKRPGLFRHPKYCNKFYACNWDPWEERFTLHIFNCPIRLTYDSSISACNWPVGGPACANDNLLV